MLFRRQHPPRLNEAEIEAVRNRARSFVEGFGKRDFTLTDLFSLAFSGEVVSGSATRHIGQDEQWAGGSKAESAHSAVLAAAAKPGPGRSPAQKKRQPRHDKAAKYSGAEIRI